MRPPTTVPIRSKVVLSNYLLHVELRVTMARDEYRKAYPQGAASAGPALSGRVTLKQRGPVANATSSPAAVQADVEQAGVSVEVDGCESADGAPSIRQFVAARAGRCGASLVGADGTMRLSDQHVDVFVRWALPPAYLIASCVILLG